MYFITCPCSRIKQISVFFFWQMFLVNKNSLRVMLVWYPQAFWVQLSINKLMEVFFTLENSPTDFHSALYFCLPIFFRITPTEEVQALRGHLLSSLPQKWLIACNFLFSFPPNIFFFSFALMDTTLQHAFSLSLFYLFYYQPFWYFVFCFHRNFSLSWELSWKGGRYENTGVTKKSRESKADSIGSEKW